MLMLIEVGLTIAAWKKGWRWFALIPLGVAVTIAFLTGFAIGMLGGETQVAMPFFMLLDICCIVALIAMIAKPLRKSKMAVAQLN